MAKDMKKDATDLSIEEKLKNLYQLQTMLSEIDKIKTLRGELPLEVQDLEDEIEGLSTRIEKIHGEIGELNADIATRKANIEASKASIEKYSQQLDNVRNNREYESLSKEIEYQTLDVELNEKRIREAYSAIEHKNGEIAHCTELMDDRRADLDVKKSELDDIISETRSEEEKLRESAKNLEATIEPRLLLAFKRIRKNSRNGLGIVYVQRDACGGCFNQIPPQRQLDIRMRKKIIVCEYCGRIMIDPELAGVEIESKAVEEKPKRRRRAAFRTYPESDLFPVYGKISTGYAFGQKEHITFHLPCFRQPETFGTVHTSKALFQFLQRRFRQGMYTTDNGTNIHKHEQLKLNLG